MLAGAQTEAGFVMGVNESLIVLLYLLQPGLTVICSDDARVSYHSHSSEFFSGTVNLTFQKWCSMSQHAQQQEYLASIAQAFDVGEFDYLPPKDLQALNALIAAGWQALKQGSDVDAQINEIEQFLEQKR